MYAIRSYYVNMTVQEILLIRGGWRNPHDPVKVLPVGATLLETDCILPGIIDRGENDPVRGAVAELPNEWRVSAARVREQQERSGRRGCRRQRLRMKQCGCQKIRSGMNIR